MASPSEDSTLMWDIMSPDDDKAMIEKFTAESNKVINRWSLGDATFTEKDAAVSFLVQLGAVEITIQSFSQQTTSQKQVSILFHGEEDSKIGKEHREGDPGDTKDAIPSECNQVATTPDSSDQDAEKKNYVPVRLDQDITKNREAQVNEDDNDDIDDDDNNYSVWMTEPDEDDDDDDNQIPDPAPVVEESSTTQPREEHPCPDCHTVLHSLLDLDMHKLSSCKKWVYNCDQCSKSFVHKASAVNHLCKVHNMSHTQAEMKLRDLRNTKRQSSTKKRKSRESTSKTVLNKTFKKKTDYDLRRNTKNFKKYSDENVKVPQQSKKLLVRVQRLGNGWLKILKNEAVDTRKFILSKGSDGIVPISQNLNSKTDKKSSSPVSDCKPVDEESEVSESLPIQGVVQEKNLNTISALESHADYGCTSEHVQEKHKENSVTMREAELFKADGEKENGATMSTPKLQRSEAEVELSERKSSELLSEENQNEECSGEQVTEENKDVSTFYHVGTDPEVNETPEPSQEQNLDVTTEKGAKEIDSEDNDDNEKSEDDQKPAKGKNLICNFCGLQFESYYVRKKHVLKIHTKHVQEFKCSTCKKSFTNKSAFKSHLTTHIDVNDREKHCCKICKKSFLIKKSYQKHMKSHFEKQKKIKCDTCGKLLSGIGVLQTHIKTLHNKEIVYTCQVCGKNVYSKHELKEHLATHKGEKNWKCDECGFAFTHKFRLKEHKRLVHTIKGQCLCEICGAAFKIPSNLKQHHRTAHTNVYKFSCDVCGKKFKRSSILNVHVKIHSNDPKHKPWVCEICGKGFRQKGKLRVHMDWHNNVRKHTCQDCGKSFLTKGNLEKHQYIHIGKKPHECRICSQGFTDMPSLRKHLDIKHQITLKKRVTEGVSDERINKGSAANLLAHKLAKRPSSPSTSVTESEDRTEVVDVAQLSEASDSQIVKEALLAMMND